MINNTEVVSGVGLGFRRDLADALLHGDLLKPRFVELAPENWMNIGGRWGKTLRAVTERYPILCHGLSLSLGSPEPLDWEFLAQIKSFLKQTGALIYSEHLSFNKCDNAHLYDLLPIPFCEGAVHHVSSRIKQVQDFLECKIAIENVSYYATIAPHMDEASFIRAVIKEADCNLLLDVNNVFVNSFNHAYDPRMFLTSLPLDKVVYIHMAGHEQKSPELIIDTHGQPISEAVFELFDWTLQHVRNIPILLERDFNFPAVSELAAEMSRLQNIVDGRWGFAYAA